MSQSRRIMRMLAVLTAVALFVSACGAPQTSPTAPGGTTAPTAGASTTAPTAGASPSVPAVGPEPIEKFRARISSAIVLNPLKTNTFALYSGAFVGGLWQRQLRDGSWKNDLAESVDVAPDGMTYTFVLKEGATYSDGTPVKSEDGAFAIQTHMDNVGVMSGYFKDFIDRMETPDDRTFIIHMKEPLTFILDLVNSGFVPIHPKAKIQAEGDEYWNKPVSAGPYMLTPDWVPGLPSTTMVENPTYVGGAVMIKEIEFVTVQDAQQTVLQLATGALDWAADLPFSMATGIAPEVTLGVGFRIGIYDLKFNMQATGPTGNPLVRQAIALAIDREAISQRVWFGQIPAAESYLYHDLPEFEAGVLQNGGKQDIEAAKALLAQTEWPEGFDMRIVTWAPRDGHTATVTILAEQLRAIGINVTIEADEIGAANDKIAAGDWDAFFQGTSGYPAAQQMISITCPGSSTGQQTRYDNPEACELARSLGGILDVGERQSVLNQLYAIHNQDVNQIPITDRGWLTGSRVDWDLFGFPDVGLTSQWVVPTIEEWSSR